MPNANFLLRAFLLLATLFVCAQGRVCNGHESLCARSYSNVSFVGAYNSYPVCAGYCRAFVGSSKRVLELTLDGRSFGEPAYFGQGPAECGF